MHILQGHLVVGALIFLDKDLVLRILLFSLTLVPFLLGNITWMRHNIKPLNDASIFDCDIYQM